MGSPQWQQSAQSWKIRGHPRWEGSLQEVRNKIRAKRGQERRFKVSYSKIKHFTNDMMTLWPPPPPKHTGGHNVSSVRERAVNTTSEFGIACEWRGITMTLVTSSGTPGLGFLPGFSCTLSSDKGRVNLPYSCHMSGSEARTADSVQLSPLQ